LTAALGIKKFLSNKNVSLVIINTLQVSFPLPSLGRRLIAGFRRVVRLFFLLSSNNYSAVVLFSGAGFSFYERTLMCAISRMFNTRSILMNRDGHFSAMLDSSWLSSLLVKMFLKFPTQIIVQGDSWKKLLISYKIPESKVSVIKNWISPESMIADAPISASDLTNITFTFVGWLVKEKGLHELVEAIKNLRIKGYIFSVNIIGGGLLEESLKADVIKSNIKDTINFTGWLEKHKVDSYLRKTQVLVLPSYAEGFPNVILEAMSIGIPVIATKVGAIPDTIFHNLNGTLITSKSINSLEFAMETYIKRPDLIETQSKEALSTILREHSYEQNLTKLFNLLIC
jgi:glycosyltransferase involved in cell wall biosynthesis